MRFYSVVNCLSEVYGVKVVFTEVFVIKTKFNKRRFYSRVNNLSAVLQWGYYSQSEFNSGVNEPYTVGVNCLVAVFMVMLMGFFSGIIIRFCLPLVVLIMVLMSLIRL